MICAIPKQPSDDSLTIQGIITRAADAAVERASKAGTLPVEWLSSKQLAAYIGMCEVSIARYVKAGVAPPSVKIAWDARRFRKRDVDAWIAAGGALAASRKIEIDAAPTQPESPQPNAGSAPAVEPVPVAPAPASVAIPRLPVRLVADLDPDESCGDGRPA